MINVLRFTMYLAAGVFILSLAYFLIGLCLPVLGFPKLIYPMDAALPAFVSAFLLKLVSGPYEQAEAALARAEFEAAAAEASKAAGDGSAKPDAAAQTVVSNGPVTAPTPVSSIGRRNKKTRFQKGDAPKEVGQASAKAEAVAAEPVAASVESEAAIPAT